MGHLFANAKRTRVTNILDSKIYAVQSHHPLTHIRGDNIASKLRAQYTSTIAYFNIHTDSIAVTVLNKLAFMKLCHTYL